MNRAPSRVWYPKMDDSDGDAGPLPGLRLEHIEEQDRIWSEDGRHVAAWLLLEHERDAGGERIAYLICIWEAATERLLVKVRRRYQRDLRARREIGVPIADVTFGHSGASLLVVYCDGSCEAIPVPSPLRSPPSIRIHARQPFGEDTVAFEAKPCAICSAAAWTDDVCAACARDCERLLATGGIRPSLEDVLEEVMNEPRHDTPPPPLRCDLCGSVAESLAIAGPVARLCHDCAWRSARGGA